MYCKPCLTYIVSTTQPLIELNKPLAETIGNIVVRCLYYRSGCAWQGPLADCTSCSRGCAFGDSVVVCNNCSVQIIHSQIQEHGQSCSVPRSGYDAYRLVLEVGR